MMPEPPTSTDSLFAKMKAVEARAIERLKRRRAQESPPFPPQAPEIATPQPTSQGLSYPEPERAMFAATETPIPRARRTSA